MPDSWDFDEFVDEVFSKYDPNPNIADADHALEPHDPPPGLVSFWGYLGPEIPACDAQNTDEPKAFWRLYFNLDLSSYIEFRRDQAVWMRRLDPAQPTPFPGTVVWLREHARVKFVQAVTLRQQAGFLQGPMAGAGGMPAAGVPWQANAQAGSAGCGTLSNPCNG